VSLVKTCNSLIGKYAEVDYFANLPPASDYSGQYYVVRSSSGVWFINRHEAGIYRSNGSAWIYIGSDVDTTAIKVDDTTVVASPIEFVPGTRMSIDANAEENTITFDSEGVPGPAGADGKTILSGTVDPTTEGVDGDYYINTVSEKIFGPKATTWPAGVSLIGPQGDKGDKGDQGIQGIPGEPTTISDTDSIDLTLDAGALSADVKPAGIDHDSLLNVHQDVNTDASPTFVSVDISGNPQDYKMMCDPSTGGVFSIRGQKSGEAANMFYATKDIDGTDLCMMSIAAQATPTGQNGLSFGYMPSPGSGIPDFVFVAAQATVLPILPLFIGLWDFVNYIQIVPSGDTTINSTASLNLNSPLIKLSVFSASPSILTKNTAKEITEKTMTAGDAGKVLAVKSDASDVEWVSGGISAYETSFLIADWISSGTQYYLAFTHNKNTTSPEVAIYDGTEEVMVQKVDVISANLLRIYINQSPDDRFDGSIKII
jgi:hypothetical protein